MIVRNVAEGQTRFVSQRTGEVMLTILVHEGRYQAQTSPNTRDRVLVRFVGRDAVIIGALWDAHGAVVRYEPKGDQVLADFRVEVELDD